MRRVAVFGNAGGGKSTRAAWERFSAADTLVLVDLPLITHYWWVTKRSILGLFATPKGWPPVWSSSMNSYRVFWSRHTRLTPKYSRADRRAHLLEVRSPLALSRRDRRVHRSSGPRAHPLHGSRVTWLTPLTG